LRLDFTYLLLALILGRCMRACVRVLRIRDCGLFTVLAPSRNSEISVHWYMQ